MVFCPKCICPKCKGSMATTDIVCPGCGYDFPPQSAVRSSALQHRFEYSKPAEIMLSFCELLAVIAACGSVLYSIFSLAVGNLATGLIFGPFIFFQQVGFLLVILRVRR